MNISRIKFVFLFLIFAVAFLFGTNLLLDQPPESLFGTESQVAWKSTVSTILSPIKIILMGPLVPFINFLHQDPDTPPPFFLVGFALYWIILALILHYLLSKIKFSRWLFRQYMSYMQLDWRILSVPLLPEENYINKNFKEATAGVFCLIRESLSFNFR